MYFKKLELVGFKSFYDKTVIQFEPGVTAIVGPNGCGKSNISDAIRWVLGEQSARSLRGSSMEDVIFGGSSLKEPLNLAEVSLTLSNELKILPIDYDEVTITRRLYRSGESEYLINKNAVRLKDIHELLMGTGIGTESYSIIEQGKMDIILNSKPEDRRAIFEEAAGITKFKAKKKEAIRKLEQTDQNLVRIHDIILEVQRSIGTIERQAKKAENYKSEFEKLKNLELAVASREFLLFESTRKSKEEGLEALKQQEEEFLLSQTAVEAACDDKRNRLNELDESLQESQSASLMKETEIRRAEDRILLNRERIGELGERADTLSKQRDAAEKRLNELDSEVGNLSKEYEKAHEEEAEGLQFLSSVEASFQTLENFIKDSLSDEKFIKARLLDLANQRAHHQSELAKIHAELGVLKGRLQRLERETEVARHEKEALAERQKSILAAAESEERLLNPELQSKISQFKERLKAILRRLYETQVREFGSQEEADLETEIKTFAGQIFHLQVAHSDKRGQLSAAEEGKHKLDEEEALLSTEKSQLGTEEKLLLERENHLGAEIRSVADQTEVLNQTLAAIENERSLKSAEREALLVRLIETRSQKNHCTAKREKIEKDKQWVLESKRSQEAQLVALENEFKDTGCKKEVLETESARLEKEQAEMSLDRDEILKRSEGVRHEREGAAGALKALEKERSEKQVFLKGAQEKVHAFEMEQAELRFEMDRLKERIFNAYQIDLVVGGGIQETREAAEKELTNEPDFDVEKAKSEISLQKEKLNKMGPVNLVAIQEYDEMKERLDFLTKQDADLLQAKEDLHKAILKINRTTKELFIETFEKIQGYFTEIYRLLFGGGSAELVLLDEQDVLESGIEIVVRPPGKKLQNISLLSGGEKALTAIALLFSLFKVKPSPFCILDEIDAPLDESNVDRFCHVLKGFISGSQFILITHNKRTMNLADAMYGITMAETGISKIVSVRFSDEEKAPASKEKKEVLV